MANRAAIDIGGTFTDVVVQDEKGRLHIGKYLTTPDPSVNALHGLRDTVRKMGIGLGDLSQVLHGTTAASNADLGIITMLALASSAVAALVVMYLAERWGDTITIVLGAVLIGVSLLAMPFINKVYLLELVQISYGLGRGALMTIFMALSIRAVPRHQQATAMGVYQAIYAVGMLTGPLVSGSLADSLGLASVFYLSTSLCLVIAVVACLPVMPRR